LLFPEYHGASNRRHHRAKDLKQVPEVIYAGIKNHFSTADTLSRFASA